MPLSDDLEEVRALLARYVVLADPQADALALWVALTHTFDNFQTVPYIAVLSATTRSGKSRLFETLEHLVARPWTAIDVTPATLYRGIAQRRPTLLLDEMDAWSASRAVRAILNSGYRASGSVPRTVNGVVVDFPTFGPKALAGISGRKLPLPATVLDRCVVVRLKTTHVRRGSRRLQPSHGRERSRVSPSATDGMGSGDLAMRRSSQWTA